MDKEVFQKKLSSARKMVKMMRECGSDNLEITKAIIQSVTFLADHPMENAYTESQLKELFALAEEDHMTMAHMTMAQMTRELFELSMKAMKTKSYVSFHTHKSKGTEWAGVWITDNGDTEKDLDGDYTMSSIYKPEENEESFRKAQEHLKRLISTEDDHGTNDQKKS